METLKGLIYAKLRLTNLFRGNSVEIDALVDSGATFLCVTNEITAQLGFDITETSQQVVTFAVAVPIRNRGGAPESFSTMQNR
uniref:Aspartyl protease n=1 Tax=Candidatus Kentrum sp. FW TaxID=2126338 RepID=A0A450T6E9_9GAMM|nr:MAG: hypothetical protein BECKFW1821C_GA0114237_100241 [Candidatus Kentron sp. FW]